MAYKERKSWFKDYMWRFYSNPTPTTHSSATRMPFALYYGPRGNWYDVPQGDAYMGPTQWYFANLIWTTKFYAFLNHDYDNLLGTKTGLFLRTYNNGFNPVELAESCKQRPFPATNRYGFLGQYGSESDLMWPGTTYDLEFAFGSGHMIEGEYDFEPAPGMFPDQYSPMGISMYYDGGQFPAIPGDGVHVVLIPTGTTWYVFPPGGPGVGPSIPVVGPGLAVVVGDIFFFPELVMYFTQFDDGLTFAAEGMMDPEVEYFLHLEYYPQPNYLSKYVREVDSAPSVNLDRRLRIWLMKDKKRWHYVGEAPLIEYEYTKPRRYIALFGMNAGSDSEEIPYWYWPTLHQFDGVVCGSEWLPWHNMVVHLGHTMDSSWAKIEYQIDKNELNHIPGTSTREDQVPTYLPREEVEIWNLVENHQAKNMFRLAEDMSEPQDWDYGCQPFDVETEDDINAGNLSWISHPGRTVAEDSEGNIFTVYINRQVQDQIWLTKTSKTGTVLSTETVYAPATYWQRGPSCAIDSNDVLHITWIGTGLGTNYSRYQVMYRTRDSAGVYSGVQLVTDMTGNNTYTQVMVDASNNIHIIWSGTSVGSGGGTDIAYCTVSESANWPYSDDDVNLTKLTNLPGGTNANHTHMCYNSTGKLYIAYYIYSGSYQCFMATDESGIWASHIASTAGGDARKNGCVACDEDDSIHYLYCHNTRYIYRKKWSGGSFGSLIQVYDTGASLSLRYISLYSDLAKTIHLFISRKDVGTYPFMFQMGEMISTDKAVNWSSFTRLTDVDGDNDSHSCASEGRFCAYLRDEVSGDYAIRLLKRCP